MNAAAGLGTPRRVRLGHAVGGVVRRLRHNAAAQVRLLLVDVLRSKLETGLRIPVEMEADCAHHHEYNVVIIFSQEENFSVNVDILSFGLAHKESKKTDDNTPKEKGSDKSPIFRQLIPPRR